MLILNTLQRYEIVADCGAYSFMENTPLVDMMKLFVYDCTLSAQTSRSKCLYLQVFSLYL